MNKLKTAFPAFLLVLLGFTFCQPKEKNSQSPTSQVLAESYLSWNGDSLPSYPDGKPKISIVKVTIPPHAILSKHYHPVINAGILLKGELTVVDEKGNTLKMKAGDPIIEVVNTVHYGKNEGDEPVEIVVFYAGTDGTALAVKEPTSN